MALALALAACAGPRGALVFATDFGSKDGAVAAMKGVALRVDPDLRLEDLTHDVAPFDVWSAAYWLRQTAPYWPPATVFVCVVDPGVGTNRAPIVARTRSGHLLVAPDNGLVSLAVAELGLVEARRIDEARHRREGSGGSATFDGRDLFALVGARLASGQLRFDDVGPRLERELQRLPYEPATWRDGVVSGTVEIHDPNYGNLWTNVDDVTFARLGLGLGDSVRVRIVHGAEVAFAADVPLVRAFGDVPAAAPLLYRNSLGRIALALNLGNFARDHRVGYGPEWRIELSRPDR